MAGRVTCPDVDCFECSLFVHIAMQVFVRLFIACINYLMANFLLVPIIMCDSLLDIVSLCASGAEVRTKHQLVCGFVYFKQTNKNKKQTLRLCV